MEALHNGIGVFKRIRKFVEGVSSDCRICNVSEESVDHLLLHCSTAQPIWFASPLGLRLQEDHHLTLGNLVEQWLTCQDNEYSFAMGATTSWALWKARNELVFDNK